MALNAYLKLKGQVQGDIKGSSTQRGRENKIVVIAAEHDVSTPFDAASGQAAGRRRHGQFVVTKELDKSSPLLYKALISNEKLTEWDLQFWATSTTAGQEVQRYTVKLTNASIASIKFHMPNNKQADTKALSEFEQVAFAYQKIEWIWIDGGISAQDEVASP